MNRFRWNTGIRKSVVAGMGFLFLAGVTPFWAQAPADNPEPVAPPSAQQTQAPMSPQQLDDLVAPIALYPDPLLGQALAASTYPLEIVEAQQWLQSHQNLRGTDLTSAARQQNWDPSVQALVAFPDAMKLLSQNMQWTTALGNAFLSQQADVMAAVQRMRSRAEADGRLQSSPQENVNTETQNGQQAITIQPADPNVIYVPQYDPNYIWGPPAYGYYPPLYYPAYGFGWCPGVDLGFWFGPWGGWGFGGWGLGFGWGWGFNWFGGGLFVNGGFFNHFGYRGFGGYGHGFYGGGGGLWAHDAGHRMGVGYPNAALNNRFGAASMAGRMAAGRAAVASGRATPGGGWSRFGSPGTAGARNSVEGGGRGNYQSSRGFGSPSMGGRGGYSAPANRGYSAPAGRGYSAPAGRGYSAPAGRSYSAPAGRSYAAPQQNFRSQGSYSAPRYSAPSSSFGGGRSYSAPSSSFGGGRSFSGGGGGFHGGGGGHGGGRR